MNRKYIKNLKKDIFAMSVIFIILFMVISPIYSCTENISEEQKIEKTEIIEKTSNNIFCLENELIKIETAVMNLSASIPPLIPLSTPVQTPVPTPILTPSPTPKPEYISLGQYKMTAYCPCSNCSGNWGKITSTGVVPQEGRTIAVDPNVIPYGTALIIDGNTYIAEDCGGAIKGKIVDIYFESHQDAINFGVQYKEIKIKNPDY